MKMALSNIKMNYKYRYIKNISISLVTKIYLTNNKTFFTSRYTTRVSNHSDGTTHAGSHILIKTNIPSLLSQHRSDRIQ